MKKAKAKRVASKTRPLKKTSKKKGAPLFEQVVRLTGIPSKMISNELKTILEKRNIDISNLTVEELRSAVASYVREIMLGILDKNASRDNVPH